MSDTIGRTIATVMAAGAATAVLLPIAASAQGVRAGDFLIEPKIGLETSFNDNIYLAPGNKTDDFIVRLKPAIDVKSQFDRHALNMSLNADGATYGHRDQNYIDVTAIADGRLDTWAGGSVFGLAAYRRKHEERGSTNNLFGLEPTVYEHSTLNGGVQQVLGQWGGSIAMRADRLAYKDVAANTATGIVPQQWRDRWEYSPTARVDYEFSPGMSAFVRGSYAKRQYDVSVDPNGRNRDANLYDAVLGLRVFQTGSIVGDVYAGWMWHNPEDTNASKISTPKFGGEVEWTINPVLTARAAATRSVEEVVQAANSAAVVTGASTSLDYFVIPSLALRPELGIAHLDYKAYAGQQRQKDWVYMAGIGATYIVNPRFSFGPVYRYRHRDSDLANTDYKQHIVLVEATAKF